MSNKQVYSFDEIREKIIKGVDTIADPIKGTISPKGRNVLFENDKGDLFSTNDGATVAKNINVKDSIENAAIEIIKHSSLQTNSAVGDGTSTSVLLSQILIKEGFKLIDAGWNPMDLKKEFTSFGNKLKEQLKEQTIKVKNDKDLFNIACISANNDLAIAEQVVKVVKTAGVDGMVFIEPNNKPETEIIEDTGFIIENGMFKPEFRNHADKFIATYRDVPVFLTDKRIYYKAEVDAILSTVLLAGYKKLVVFASDFIGEAVNYLTAQHLQGVISLLLVKEDKSFVLEDLAAYLKGVVISEKKGSLVDNVTIKDFVIADKIFSDGIKTVISTKNPNNKVLKDRISAIRKELEKDKDEKVLKKRLGSLTNGMVTVKVGGHTGIQVSENIFRYEDAISATRAAMTDGYLVGGGIALKTAFEKVKGTLNADLVPAFKKYCEGNIAQILLNCGKHVVFFMSQIDKSKYKNYGYNAMTDKVEDLLKAGVVDPYKVTENAVSNSISITNEIISSNFLIIVDRETEE